MATVGGGTGPGSALSLPALNGKKTAGKGAISGTMMALLALVFSVTTMYLISRILTIHRRMIKMEKEIADKLAESPQPVVINEQQISNIIRDQIQKAIEIESNLQNSTEQQALINQYDLLTRAKAELLHNSQQQSNHLGISIAESQQQFTATTTTSFAQFQEQVDECRQPQPLQPVCVQAENHDVLLQAKQVKHKTHLAEQPRVQAQQIEDIAALVQQQALGSLFHEQARVQVQQVENIAALGVHEQEALVVHEHEARGVQGHETLVMHNAVGHEALGVQQHEAQLQGHEAQLGVQQHEAQLQGHEAQLGVQQHEAQLQGHEALGVQQHEAQLQGHEALVMQGHNALSGKVETSYELSLDCGNDMSEAMNNFVDIMDAHVNFMMPQTAIEMIDIVDIDKMLNGFQNNARLVNDSFCLEIGVSTGERENNNDVEDENEENEENEENDTEEDLKPTNVEKKAKRRTQPPKTKTPVKKNSPLKVKRGRPRK